MATIIASVIFFSQHSGRDGSVALDSRSLTLLTHILRLIDAIAHAAPAFVQRVLGIQGDGQVEFYHLLSFAIKYCSEHVDDGDGSGVRTMLDALLRTVTRFCWLAPSNAAMLHWGVAPTILQRLTHLPFDYFALPSRADVLFPALIAACCQSPRNLSTLGAVMDPAFLANYLQAGSEQQLASISLTRAQREAAVATLRAESEADRTIYTTA